MKKPSMGMLVLGKPEKSSGEGMGIPGGGADSAAKAVLKAIKADDAAALSEALQLHYELCMSPDSGNEEGE